MSSVKGLLRSYFLRCKMTRLLREPARANRARTYASKDWHARFSTRLGRDRLGLGLGLVGRELAAKAQ